MAKVIRKIVKKLVRSLPYPGYRPGWPREQAWYDKLQVGSDAWYAELSRKIVANEDAKRRQSRVANPEEEQLRLEREKRDIILAWPYMSVYGRSMTPPELVPEGASIDDPSAYDSNDDSLVGSLLDDDDDSFSGSLLDNPKPNKMEVKQKGKDKWGFRLGSGAAQINSVITEKEKTAKQIHVESRCGRSVSGHLKRLEEMELIIRTRREGKEDTYKLVDRS